MAEVKSAPRVELEKYSPRRAERHRGDLLPIDYQRYLILGTVYIGGDTLVELLNKFIDSRHPDIEARAQLCNCLESNDTLSYNFFNYGPEWNNNFAHTPQTRPTGVVVLPYMRFRTDYGFKALNFDSFYREEQYGRKSLRPSFFDEVNQLCREQRTPLIGIRSLQFTKNFLELNFDERDAAIEEIISNRKLVSYLYQFFNGTVLPN